MDLSVRVRQGHSDAAFLGLIIPIGPTRRILSLSNSWSTMPISWPDRNNGIGPLKTFSRLGRKGCPKTDYRSLQLSLAMGEAALDLLPERGARGTADANDAVYVEHFLDQVLAAKSQLVQPAAIRPQPEITWRADLPRIDAPQTSAAKALLD